MTGSVMRIRNVTPNLDRGGTCAVWEVPSHTITGAQAMGFGEISSAPGSSVYDSNLQEGEYIEVIWHPQNTNIVTNGVTALEEQSGVAGMEFTHYGVASTNQANTAKFSELIFISEDPTGKPQSWEISTYSIYEIRGLEVKTKTVYDRSAIGWTAAVNAFSDLQAKVGHLTDVKEWHDQEGDPEESGAPIVSEYIKVAADFAKEVIPIGMQVAELLGLS
jgi:hypothetical protein